MANKYKVTGMIGEDEETGKKYKFSFPGSHWDCQSAWAAQVKQGNNEANIMILAEKVQEDGTKVSEWIPDTEGMDYARKRFNLNAKVYNVALFEHLVAQSKALAEYAKAVKGGKYTAVEHENLVQLINVHYDFVSEHSPTKE